MPDHGRELQFGFFLEPRADAPVLDRARRLEELGYDLIGIQDHPYQRRFHDTLSLLAAITAVTERITVFPDVANLPLRPPAVLAKAAATIDLLGGGRFELGLGAGGFWDAIAAYGGPRRSPAEALAALGEAIEVIRLVWSGERNLRVDGDHHHLAGAQSGPVPAHDIGIWLGVYGPRALALAGRAADGWVPSLRGDLDQLAAMVTRLDSAAVEAGRDPGAIRRVLNVNGVITDGGSEGVLHGPVEQWVDRLSGLALDLGFDTFVVWSDAPHADERFIEEVAPAVREAVGAARRPPRDPRG